MAVVYRNINNMSKTWNWYGHVMRKRDEDWVKKCMELKKTGWKTKKDMARECGSGYGRT